MAIMTAPRSRPRSRGAQWFSFTARLPVPLRNRVDEGRYQLRFKSRNALIIEALEKYLDRHNVPAVR